MVEIKLDAAALARLGEAAKAAALETMEAVKTDLENSKTVPFDNGTTEGSLYTDQKIDGSELHTVLGTDTLYARYLYYGRLMLAPNGSAWARSGEKKSAVQVPLNFQRGHNPNAGAAWYAPYEAGGGKEALIPETFAARMKEKL